MDRPIWKQLAEITEEEQKILDSRMTIDRELYMRGQGNTVRKLRAFRTDVIQTDCRKNSGKSKLRR